MFTLNEYRPSSDDLSKEISKLASSSVQIWKNVALHHLLTSESSAVNGCRQNEIPNSW